VFTGDSAGSNPRLWSGHPEAIQIAVHQSVEKIPSIRLTAEVVKNLSAASGVAYVKSGAILSVQARLRIRLLPWMSSGEASIRIGMQNAGLRNPPEQERGETISSHLCALTATN